MNTQNLDQRRAAHAMNRVKKWKNSQRQSDYLSYVKALPASILQNGLGQAFATLLAATNPSDDEDPHFGLCNDLQDWLCRDDSDAPYPKATGVLEAITTMDQNRYLCAQAEALLYLGWLKRFAAAFLSARSQDKTNG